MLHIMLLLNYCIIFSSVNNDYNTGLERLHFGFVMLYVKKKLQCTYKTY